MIVSRSILFVLIAAVCFVVALLVALGALHGNGEAWQDGGLVSLALSFLP